MSDLAANDFRKEKWATETDRINYEHDLIAYGKAWALSGPDGLQYYSPRHGLYTEPKEQP